MTTYIFKGQLIWRGAVSCGDSSRDIDVDLSDYLDLDSFASEIPFDKIKEALVRAIAGGAAVDAAKKPTCPGHVLIE